MADSKKGRSVTPPASAALGRIAGRVGGDEHASERLLAFVDRNAEAEALATYIVLQLKEAIGRSGSSAYAIAKRTGVSESAIGKFLSGEKLNLTLETLTKLCADLGLVVMLAPKPKSVRGSK
jgi:DNA-binding Xre family transcriptional regulator